MSGDLQHANQSTVKIPALTGARFVAALTVVLYHVRGEITGIPPSAIPLFHLGGAAVSFFYMLSGLVLTLSYQNRIKMSATGFSRFFCSRLARIYPVYFLALLVTTFVLGDKQWDKNVEQGWRGVSWVIHCFAAQAFFPIPAVLWKWNGPGWSVSCELFFYALFPFLLHSFATRLTTRRRIVIAIVGLIVGQYLVAGMLMIAIRYSFQAQVLRSFQNLPEALSMVTTALPPLRLFEFAIGIALGFWISMNRKARSITQTARQRSLLLLTCLTAVYAIAALPWNEHGELVQAWREYLAFVPLLTLILFLLCSGRHWLTALLESRWCVRLGEASYSLYLFHALGLYGMQRALAPFSFSVSVPILCVTITTLALCSLPIFSWIEMPARQFLLDKMHSVSSRPHEVLLAKFISLQGSFVKR